MDLARAPRRARSNARKKGSGYGNGFARKSVHLHPVLHSKHVKHELCRCSTLAVVLSCCKILVVIYFNLFNNGKSRIVVLF
jgi:hypothetical protein